MNALDALPPLNLELAEQYCRTIERNGGGWTFQTFDDSERKLGNLARIKHATDATLQRTLKELSSLNTNTHSGVFLTVNRTDGKGRTIKNITAIRAVFVDGDDIAMPDEWHVPPSVRCWRSETRWHAYWLLQPGTPLEAFADAQKRLAKFYGTDPKIFDLPRVMRVPGFLHMKARAEEVRCTIHDNGLRTLAEVMLGIPELEKIQPPAPTPAQRAVADVQDRAAKYVAKIPGAVSGQAGHNSTFHVACVLILGFGLSVDQARPVLNDWNRTCQPPWTEREIEHKLHSAAKQDGERGYLLKNENDPRGKTPQVVEINEADAAETISDSDLEHAEQEAQPEPEPQDHLAGLDNLLGKAKSGEDYACPMPWPDMAKATRALKPATLFVICGTPGATKSLCLLQLVRYLLKNDVSAAVLELEDGAPYHLWRALAQISGESELTDERWCRENPDKVDHFRKQAQEQLAALSGAVQQLPPDSDPTAENLVLWLERNAPKNRVLAIDPISFMQTGRWVYDDCQRFLRGAKKVIEQYRNSLILITHPTKPAPGQKVLTAFDIAGGQVYFRFCQTIMALVAHDPTPKVILSPQGAVPMDCNRTWIVFKARNGRGAENKQYGGHFDGSRLELLEYGEIRRQEND